MTYTPLTPNERARQTIYNVYNFLKLEKSISGYYQQYKENETQRGRCQIVLPMD